VLVKRALSSSTIAKQTGSVAMIHPWNIHYQHRFLKIALVI